MTWISPLRPGQLKYTLRHLPGGIRVNHLGICQWGGSDRGRSTEFRDEDYFGETGQSRRLVDGFRQLLLNFKWSVSEPRIGFMMNDSHTNGAVRVLVTVIVVMERFPQK